MSTAGPERLSVLLGLDSEFIHGVIELPHNQTDEQALIPLTSADVLMISACVWKSV